MDKVFESLPIFLLCINISCVIFSIFYAFKDKKNEKQSYKLLDKVTLITNILIIVLTLPYLLMGMYITLLMLSEIRSFTLHQSIIVICTHLSISMVSLTLAQSRIFRCHGKSIESFLIQFVGVLWLVISLLFFRTIV